MKKQITILLALALFYNLKTTAQELQHGNAPSIFTSVDEAVFLNGNTSTLLSGETFYYKLYCWNTQTKSFSEISKIAYVQLVNAQGKSMIKQKVNLEDGLGTGDFFIPTELKTGNYKLLAYTRWMLNEPISKMFQMDILIINPFMALPKNMITKTKTDSIPAPSESNSSFGNKSKEKSNFSFTKEMVFGPRGKVEFTLNASTTSLKPGNYSISVRKLDKLPRSSPVSPKEFMATLKEDDGSTANNQKFLPELRGELFIGTIENKVDPKNISNKTVALSLPGESFAFKTSQTDNNGKFWIVLDSHPNTSNAVIQVMEDDRENYSMRLEKTNVDLTGITFKNFQLNPDLQQSIEERSTAVQIENAYYHKKHDSLLSESTIVPFYFPLAKDYVLGDYTSFPKLEETIVEIIPEMYSTKKKNNYSIHLRDYYNDTDQAVYGKTLVLIDGLLVQNHNLLFAYDTRKIKKISIVPKGYIYGAKIYNGIAVFTTKEQDFQSGAQGDFILKTELLRPLPKKEYFKTEYGTSTKNERIPDYRHQLLWLPEVLLSEDAKQVSFFTSDVTGNFEIILEGFSNEGKPIYQKQVFEVR